VRPDHGGDVVEPGGIGDLEIFAEDGVDIVFPGDGRLGREEGAPGGREAGEFLDIDGAIRGGHDTGVGYRGRGLRPERDTGIHRLEGARLEAVEFPRGIGFVRHGGVEAEGGAWAAVQ
jgi:hypothetical protein